METVKMQAWMRERRSRSYLNELRRQGKLPAVMYGKGAKDMLLAVDRKELETLLRSRGGANAIIELKVEGEKAEPFTVMVRDVQRESLGGGLAHVDLYRVNLNEKVRTELPLHLVGEAKGVKQGGTIQFGLRSVEVEGLPRELPPSLDVDISDLEIGDKLTVAMVTAPAGVAILSDPEQVIASIIAPRMVMEEEEPEVASGAESNAVEGSKDQAE